MEKKVDKLTTQIMMIKPFCPTPNHKKTVRLSLVDQLVPSAIYVPIVLFYANPINRSLLTTSLSEVLTQFYPYAGRFVDNCSIECTDDGVLYSESEVDCFQSDILSIRDPNMLEQFLPVVTHLEETIPLLIQTNFFKCGGFALGIMASHRIMDAGALSTFISSWAITASGNKKMEAPDFSIPSSLYPPSDFLNTIPERSLDVQSDEIYLTKRFVFYGSSIAELKVKLASISQPTRVESVSALIWKSAMKASQTLEGSRSSSILLQAVNTRKRWEPSLPDKTPGNNMSLFPVQIVYDDNELSFLVQLFKDGIREFCENYMKKLQESVQVRCGVIFETMQEIGNMFNRDEHDMYIVTSWCKFPIYDADFGRGKPVWIARNPFSVKNNVLLMDTKEGDGIEAWISLEAKHMAAFEQDEDLLHFATCPPPNVSNS